LRVRNAKVGSSTLLAGTKSKIDAGVEASDETPQGVASIACAPTLEVHEAPANAPSRNPHETATNPSRARASVEG